MISTDAVGRRDDRELLEALRRREGAALEELMARYGGLVCGAVRRVLGNAADAEDACQATFLVLLQKSPALRGGESLGGWLHTVAVHLAQRIRQRSAARVARERAVARPAIENSEPGGDWLADLDAALAALPDPFRLPLILCYFEGKTGDVAANELGCSRSTLTRRLTEGRELLRRRLTAGGVVVPVAALLLALENAAVAASPPTSMQLSASGVQGATVQAGTWAREYSSPAFSIWRGATIVAGLLLCLGLGWIWARQLSPEPRQAAPASSDPATSIAASQDAGDAARTSVAPEPPARENHRAAVTKPGPAAPPPHDPVLRDDQQVGVWKGPEFHWQRPDPQQTRPVAFAVTIPAGHRFLTVAVDDADGRRVRNLLDAVDVAKVGGRPDADGPQVLAVEWNGLDDRGRMLPDGSYRMHGCSHPGVKCLYEYSFLNPGTPPWEHYRNSGWGGDHGFPHAIACLRGHGDGPWRVALGGTVGEGGDPGFVLGKDDRKTFAFKRGWAGPKALCAVDGQLWVGLWSAKDLLRLEYHTGKQIPFDTPAGKQPTLTFDADVWGIAVGTSRVAVRLHDEKDAAKERVVLFDRETGERRVEVRFTVPLRRNGLAMLPDGRTLLVSSDEVVFSLDVAAEAPRPERYELARVEKPGALALGPQGELFIHDRGADDQVKVFDAERRLRRTIGTRGGQGARLEFDAEAVHGVEAMSVDDRGALWVAENGDLDRLPGRGFVRRIAVWDSEGRFEKDFVGTTWYGANNTCLHEQDPTLALGYGVIYKLDRTREPVYRPWRYVTSGQPADAPLWHWTGSPGTLFGSVRLFRSAVSGVEREYLLQMNGFPILFQADDAGDYRPILAIGSHAHQAVFPEVAGEPQALHLWTDLNHDARPQEEEFQRIPGTNYSVHFFMGWGFPPPQDLVWRMEGRELRPLRFTDAGVPVYDVARSPALAEPHHFLRVGRHLVATVPGKWDSPEAGYFFAGNYLFTDGAGKPRATYRSNWPGVHASWQSHLAKPGQTGRTVGELFFAGSADTRSDVGHVICPQGNQGQAFLLSEEGLFVAALFQDTRESPDGWGEREVPGADWSRISLYSECFGGWFGRQADGVVRYMFGRNACHVVRVVGLEDIRKFEAGAVTLAGPTRGGAAAPQPAPAESSWRIPNVKGRFPRFQADGDPAEWQGLPRREIRIGDDVVARVALAHSLEHLWVLAEIVDASPWKNEGEDAALLFKTGDALDIQLGPAQPSRRGPIEGDVRLLIAPGLQPRGVVYRPVCPSAKPEEQRRFESPVHALTVDSVRPLANFQCGVREVPSGYVVELRLSCDQIDLRHAERGLQLRGDFGVLWGNAAGRTTERRAYLFNRNPAATIVSDTPSEARLLPADWGQWTLE